MTNSNPLRLFRFRLQEKKIYIYIQVYLFAAMQVAYLTGCFQEVPMSLHPENITIALGIHYFAI